MVELAREIAGDSHGFRFMQLPYNLAMPEALTLHNQTAADGEASLLEAASALGITVVASASFCRDVSREVCLKRFALRSVLCRLMLKLRFSLFAQRRESRRHWLA